MRMFKFLGPRSRINYWSCSKVADKIRGFKKPKALSLEGWEDWNNNLKKESPIRYWASEELLDVLQDIVYFPSDIYRFIKNYIRNRYIDKTHVLSTGLTPGKYYEFDHRVLYGLFNELVNYVEVELAHTSLWDTSKKYKFVKGRCVEAGLDSLYWAKNLKYGENDGVDENDELYGKPTEQAKVAEKTLELYNWWKFGRPNRKCPMDVSGWGKICSMPKEQVNAEEKKDALLKLREIETFQEDEDTEKLIELIKIRKSLWT